MGRPWVEGLNPRRLSGFGVEGAAVDVVGRAGSSGKRRGDGAHLTAHEEGEERILCGTQKQGKHPLAEGSVSVQLRSPDPTETRRRLVAVECTWASLGWAANRYS
jgi:hypothetical protein